MNRGRGLDGVNSYANDLGFDTLAWLRRRVAVNASAAWLDLCCGSGRALIQAARQRLPGLTVTGVDLVDYFDEHEELPGLTLTAASVASWRPSRAFDLITCVHGLHYVGDKLGILAAMLTWLAPQGFLAAHLDLHNVKAHGAPLRRLLAGTAIAYNQRRNLITCNGPTTLNLPLRYLGADDRAGPNVTGQPAVDSHYERRLD